MTLSTGVGRGGKKPGAGRKRNPYRTALYAKKVLEAVENDRTGKLQTPLEFLIRTMQSEDVDYELRWKSAVAAAPYCHAKLQSIEVKDPNASRMTVVIRDFSDRNAILSSTVDAGGMVQIQQHVAMPAPSTSRDAVVAAVIDDMEQGDDDSDDSEFESDLDSEC